MGADSEGSDSVVSLDILLGTVGKRSDGVSQSGNHLSYSKLQGGPVSLGAAPPGLVKPGTGSFSGCSNHCSGGGKDPVREMLPGWGGD